MHEHIVRSWVWTPNCWNVVLYNLKDASTPSSNNDSLHVCWFFGTNMTFGWCLWPENASSFSVVKICCFSLTYLTVNWIYKCVQKKTSGENQGRRKIFGRLIIKENNHAYMKKVQFLLAMLILNVATWHHGIPYKFDFIMRATMGCNIIITVPFRSSYSLNHTQQSIFYCA